NRSRDSHTCNPDSGNLRAAPRDLGTTRTGHERNHRVAPAAHAPVDSQSLDSVRVHAIILIGHRSEEHTSELQSREKLVCRLLLARHAPRLSPLSLHAALPISIGLVTVTRATRIAAICVLPHGT